MDQDPVTRWAGRACDLLFALLTIGAIRRTFHDAELNDADFHVYWQAAHGLLTGLNPYAYTAADQGFVFKYPPWILPLFLPLGLLSFESARIAWFGIELVCIGYTIRWCIHQGVARRLAIFVAFLFWWMLQAHISAGQFTIVLLATALWAVDGKSDAKPRGGFREALLTWVLSAKVFSLYTLAGIWRRFLKPGPWVWGAGLFGLAHVIVLAINAYHGVTKSLFEIYRDFMAAASSGGAELGAIIVRGQGNHGLTALVLRSLNVDSLSFASDMLTSMALVIPLGMLWNRYSKWLTEAEAWTGWIGIGLIVHPLAWHHSFVLAYPLCALSIARASRTGSRKLVALALLGTCMIGILIPQVIGKTLVKPYELAGGKSWGVVLAGVAMVLAAKAARLAPPRTAA